MKKLLFPLYWLIVTLILLEIVVRIWGYAEHYIYDPIYEPFPQTADIPFIHQANLQQARGRGQSLINTDSLGLRSLESGTVYGPKQVNEIRIVILGDSVTFGEGVRETADTYPHLVETSLQAQFPNQQIRVFNFGVSAYSVRTMVATLQHRALALQPDFVIMAVAPQDFDLHRTGEVDRWGYNVREVDNSRFPLLSRLKRSLRAIRLTYAIRDLTLRWRSHNIPTPPHWQLPDTYSYLPQFQAIASEHNIPSLLLLLPTHSSQSFQALPDQLAHDNLPMLNLLDLGSDLPAEQFQASPFDGHPSAQVHQLIAVEVVAYWETAVFPSTTFLPPHLFTPQNFRRER
ncbi:MAG: hypothetical protein H6658_10695 [Ardenticatenaceae bacterium]|nr:hypothetical protein [Ardenticatenaceae bacterium]